MSSNENCEVKKTLVKPADLPIYDVIANDAQATQAKPEEPNAAVQAVKTIRLAITDGLKQVEAAKGQVDHILETGKAHTESSLAILKDEENLPMRAAFIGGGGLLGLIFATLRGRRFFGKTLNTAVGAGLFTSMLYPEDAMQVGKDVVEEGQRLSKIAVNFVQGVAPQDSASDKNADLNAILSDEDKKSLDNHSPK